MKRNVLLSLAALVACAAPAMASNALVESWEGTLDGWQVPSPFGTDTTYTAGFSTTSGVTNGSDSLAVSSPSTGPNYGQLLISPSSQALTTLLGNAAALNLDVFAPSSSFGGFLQFDVDLNNNDTGFQSLDSFSYPATTIGSETTMSFAISPSIAATLATSANPTTIIIQVGGGFTAGNETMYLDNLTTTVAPEPASLSLIGLGGAEHVAASPGLSETLLIFWADLLWCRSAFLFGELIIIIERNL